MNESLHQIVRRAEQNLLQGTTKLGENVDWSMHDTVERIFAYLNSKHTSGDKDSLGRDKPFFNIVTAAVNIWYRATDLDRKDIIVLPDKSSNVGAAFLATVLLQEWMKHSRFGVFLNLWGRTLAAYGSAVVKFVEKNGELVPSVIPWNRLIVDPVDFYALPRIEKFYKTPAQLKNMATKGHPDYAGYNMDIVESLLDNVQTRETLRGEKIDIQSNFIELYEVHGELSLATYNQSKDIEVKDGDEDIFFQQMHVLSWVEGKDGKDVDFTIFSGKEKKDPYMITHLIEEDGRTLAIGAVEYLFDAQWMQNHTIKAWKDQMDLASKLVFQTADQSFVGQNVLTSIENGDILYHAKDSPLTMINNVGHDITTLQNFSTQWKVLAQEITSTPDALRGNTLPSGTPYSLGGLLTQNASSLFEIMAENKGNAVEEMLRTYIIPWIKTHKLSNNEEIATVLEDNNIKKLDSMFVPNEATRRTNDKLVDMVLDDEVPTQDDQDQIMSENQQEITSLLGANGNTRFLSPGDVDWKEVVKDLEWKLDVGITNEQHDKQAIMTTLSTVLQTIASNPMILQDPNAKMVFNKILSQTGTVSPIELSATQSQPQPLVAQPEGGGVGAGMGGLVSK